MELTVRQTDEFADWLHELPDPDAARITSRIVRVQVTGNLGDTKSVGNKVSELRFHFGPGYRVYYTKVGREILLLLAGGDKGTQDRDIQRAKQIAERELE